MAVATLSDDALRLAEINHRVVNTLHTVASLLRAQAARAPDRRSADALLAANVQIHAFALLGQALARWAEGSVYAADDLRELTGHLDDARLAPRAVALRRQLPDTLPVNDRAAQAPGLIATELEAASQPAFSANAECVLAKAEARRLALRAAYP